MGRWQQGIPSHFRLRLNTVRFNTLRSRFKLDILSCGLVFIAPKYLPVFGLRMYLIFTHAFRSSCHL